MPRRTVGRHMGVAFRSSLGAVVVSLLISGCAPGPPASGASNTPAAAATSSPGSSITGHLKPVPMELVSTITGAPNLFSAPDGIGLDPQGNLYVADGGNSRIQKLDGDGHPIKMWGSHGSGDGQLDCDVCGLAVDGHGNVFVTDAGNARVQVFDTNGTFLKAFGSSGNDDGQFLSPFGITVDRQGNVYVADPLLSRVQKFDGAGNVVSKWGSRGIKDGQFSEALADIAVDGSGNIYVTDRSNGVQKFDSDMKFVSRLTACGDDRPLASATGIALDAQGNIYVYDLANDRICKYDDSGTFLTSLGGLAGAVGLIAVGQQGDIYGAELDDGVVLRFHKP